MMKEFEWYFPLSNDEINDIWNNGILTVDANVLLDLYRYHESTRNSLISSLKDFQGRLWLSNQAAEEFIRNRTKVIVSSEKTFKEAISEVEKLKSNFDSTSVQLNGNRIIPTEVIKKLQEAINPAIDEAISKIKDAKKAYPKYLKDDPILKDLSDMFVDSVGDAFKEDELVKLNEEAKKRQKNEIPPGYLDFDKDDNRPYGDFFLWHQILLHSKNEETPIILVTSERKEDWWEKISGKTIGPRPELLREANKVCGQRILIYQTDRFLEYSSKRSGGEINNSAVEEIRAVDNLRTEFEQAVEIVKQDIEINTEFLNEGQLVLNLRRPVRNLTGSGSFEPRMQSIPIVEASLIEAPQDIPKYKVRTGAGNNNNFNLHVISSEYGELLPIGQYVLEYKATCENPNSINSDAQIEEKEI